MNLRYYAAIVTGALADVMTMWVLWFMTQMQVEDMFAWGMTVYIVVAVIVLQATEPKVRPRWKPKRDPQIYTLDPRDYYKLAEVQDGRKAS